LVVGGLDLLAVGVDQVGVEVPEQELLHHPDPPLVRPGDNAQASPSLINEALREADRIHPRVAATVRERLAKLVIPEGWQP
jgi:hypothetical protein